MWRVIQTRPFQRLRRIKQLGFSEFVYPGATHTRFAHSIGVFHTARQLMRIIERDIRSNNRHFLDSQARVALAAALVHDLGHGMFSHAFEDVGQQLDLDMAHHEEVSNQLIRDSEVSEVFRELGSGFANDVAAVIQQGGPGNLYNAVVSSQFDADRLDYMRRDRLMTGVQNSGIDYVWLLNNLQIGEVGSGVDEESLDKIQTFVLGPKSKYAAEAYVLSLFQLYPTVYLHKATRGAEKVFSALMSRVVELSRDGSYGDTGLPGNHPFVEFAKEPQKQENALRLDDTVFWGALPLMAEAADSLIANYTKRLHDRNLLKCIDIRELLHRGLGAPDHSGDAMEEQLERLSIDVEQELRERSAVLHRDNEPRILIDRCTRVPYRHFQESKGPLNQIRIHTDDGKVRDLAECSPVVAGLEEFHVLRAYVDQHDDEAKSVINQIITEKLRSN